jgi:hypothetical protein
MHDQKQDPSDAHRPSQSAKSPQNSGGYPLGRGYGHDYMRGGEVFGGYGYSDRPEYAQTRGELKNGS